MIPDRGDHEHVQQLFIVWHWSTSETTMVADRRMTGGLAP